MPASFRSRAALSAGLAFGLLAAAPLSSLAQTSAPATPPTAPAPTAAPSAPAAAPATAPVALLPVGPDGAREVARQIDDFISQVVVSKQTKATFEWKGGSPVVTPAGDRYDIATPPLVVRWAGDAGVEIGTAKFQATPQADGTLVITGTPPTRVVLLDKGKEDGSITIDQAAFSGVWSSTYHALLTTDLTAGPAHLAFIKDNTKAELVALVFKQGLTRDHDDLFSGSGTWSLTGLTVKDKDAKPLFSLNRVGADSTVTRIDLARLAKLRDSLQSLPPEQVTPDKILPLVRGLIAGVNGTLSAETLRFTPPGEASDAGLKSVSFTVGLDGLDGEAGNAKIAFELNDVFGPFPAEAAPVVPTKAALSLRVDHLPSDLLTQLTSVPGGLQSPAVPAILLAAVQKAGVITTLDSLVYDTAQTGTSAKGALTFAPGAAQGATGSMIVTVRGIDALIQSLKPKAGAKPDKNKKNDTDGLLAGLTMLQMMGQPGKDDQGRELRTFNLDLAADGAVKLNGVDLSALMGSMPSAGPAAGKPPTKDDGKAKAAKPSKSTRPADSEDDDEDDTPPAKSKPAH